MKPKLEPCPLCGGKAVAKLQQPGGTGSSGMEPDEQKVGCPSCDLWLEWESPKAEWGKQSKHDKALAEKQALRWNKRVGKL